MHMNKKDDTLSRVIAKIELLSYFRQHPHIRDTSRGFAKRLWLDTEAVESVLNDLVSLGIMTKSFAGEYPVYRLRVSYATSSEADPVTAGEH